MQNYDNSRLAHVAARWWTDRLDGSAKQDYGLTQTDVDILNMIQTKHVELEDAKQKLIDATKKNIPSEGKRFCFKKILTKFIEKELNERGYAYLYVEIGAEGLLGLAAHHAKIKHDMLSAFPVYTEMFIEKGKIEIKYGKSEKYYREIFNLDTRQKNRTIDGK